MDFLTLGISFKTAPLPIRERVVLSVEAVESLLREVKDAGVLREALVLSTCNRTEFYAVHRARPDTLDYMCALMKKITGTEVMSDPGVRYVLRRRNAVEHLFRVAAGLESMVIGETQITGQVKDAYSSSCRAGTNGAFLNRLLHMTFAVAKKVRTQTGIGTGATSIASAAVRRLQETLKALDNRTVLLIGAGRNGELVAKHLLSSKVARLLITNRSHQKARRLAAGLGAEFCGFDQLRPLLKEVDAVVTTTSSPRAIVTRFDLQNAMAGRQGRSLVIADIAAPRDVEPEAADIKGITLFDLDSLEKEVDASLSNRRRMAVEAEQIVQTQVVSFLAWYRALKVKPIVIELEKQTDALRRDEIKKLRRSFSEDQIRTIDHFSRSLLRRILHNPLSQIKQCDRSTHVGMMRLDTIRDLFGLSDE